MTKMEATEILRWLKTKSPTIRDYAVSYSFDRLNEACETITKGDAMPSGQKQLTGGIKHDESKRRLDLVPSSLTNAVARILEFGAKKYGDNNWKKGLVWSRVYAALQRHLTDFWDGNDLDSESALPHLYHAACNVAFLIEFYEKRKDLDDRYKIPEPQESLADKAERAKRLMNE